LLAKSISGINFSHPLSPATSSATQINVLSIFIIVFFLVNVQKYEILPVNVHFFSLRRAEPFQAPPGIRIERIYV
jgi:hypothetical protein